MGHVQKRLGTRLRELRHTRKGQVLSDGKGLSGKGRLTDKRIDQLQTYYGWAIRENNHLQDMARAIWGGLMHRCSTDDEPQHQFCPPGEDSWCKWQQVKAGARVSYSYKQAILKAVFEAIKPTYIQLADKKLLERRLMGATQNAKESLHSPAAAPLLCGPSQNAADRSAPSLRTI